GRLQYHRTAIKITSGGQRYPKRGGRIGDEVPVTGTTMIPLATAGLRAIAFCSGVLARRARAHRCRMYPAPHDFTNSWRVRCSCLRPWGSIACMPTGGEARVGFQGLPSLVNG